MLEKLCGPAILYIGFSITQIILDIFQEMYNTAFLKFMVMIIFSIILNIFCKRNLGVIAWLIVFIQFISMSILTSIILYVFGLSPMTGGLNYQVSYPDNNQNPPPSSNKNVVVVTNSGVNQPYDDNKEVEPGVYTVPPTADEVNNYNNVNN